MRIACGFALGALLLCLAGPAAATGFEFYVLGGPVFANLGGDADQFGRDLAAELASEIGGSWTSEKKTRTGFDLGAGISYTKTGTVGGALEIRYAQRGVKWDLTETTGSGVSATTTMKLDYVELPLLLQVTPPTSGSVSPVVVIGPVLGIRASSDFDVEASDGSQSVDVGELMKDTYFGGLVGAGARIRAGERAVVMAQARFQLGFGNLFDGGPYDVKPQDFSVMAGVGFGF